MDERVEQVDEQDQAFALVLRSEAVRLGLLHRVAVTMCRDRDGRILVHRRSERASRFRFVTKFLNRSGLSPHWLCLHEAVIPVEVRPDHNEVVRHGWLAKSELFSFMEQQLFTPDSGQVVDRYFTGFRSGPSTDGSAAPGDG